MSEEIRINTLGQFLDQDYRFDLWCPHCRRGKTVGPEKFVEKLGRDHPMDVGAVSRHARCSHCGGKGSEVRIRPPTPRLDRGLP